MHGQFAGPTMEAPVRANVDLDGHLPANISPNRTLVAFQAHRVDTSFCDRFSRPGPHTGSHAEHFERWHGDA